MQNRSWTSGQIPNAEIVLGTTNLVNLFLVLVRQQSLILQIGIGISFFLDGGTREETTTPEPTIFIYLHWLVSGVLSDLVSMHFGPYSSSQTTVFRACRGIQEPTIFSK